MDGNSITQQAGYNDFLTKEIDIPVGRSIDYPDMETGSVGTRQLMNESVGTVQLQDASVTSPKYVENSVGQTAIHPFLIQYKLIELTVAQTAALHTTPQVLLGPWGETGGDLTGYMVHSVAVSFGQFTVGPVSQVGYGSVGASDKLRFEFADSAGTPNTNALREIDMVGFLDTPPSQRQTTVNGVLTQYNSTYTRPFRFRVRNPGDGITDATNPGVSETPGIKIHLWYSLLNDGQGIFSNSFV